VPHLHTPPLQIPAEPALQGASELQKHWDAWHKKPGGQAWPQVPQFAGVLASSASHPSAYAWLQSAKPMLHDAIAQVELLHAAVPFPTEHVLPQAPQFMGSVVRFVVQAAPEQAPFPAGQLALPQVPFTQFGVPPSVGQTCPQVPQLVTSDDVFASQPFAIMVSQLEYSGRHDPSVHMPPEHCAVAFGSAAQSERVAQPTTQLPSAEQWWPMGHAPPSGMHSTQAPDARSQNGVPGIVMQSASRWQGLAPPAPPLEPASEPTTMKSPTPKIALQPARTVPPATANSRSTRIGTMLAHVGRATNPGGRERAASEAAAYAS
jgi:hypothetical protein